jgi:hypothetical protein
MSTLQAEFEALMPRPFDHLYEFASPFGGTTLRESASEYNGNRPKRSIALFTADQVRQAMLDATERAAKKCDQHAADAPNIGEHYAATECAAAIRGGGQG